MNSTMEEQLDAMLRALLRIRDEVSRADGSVERHPLVSVEYIHREVNHALNTIGLGSEAHDRPILSYDTRAIGGTRKLDAGSEGNARDS